MSVVLPIMIPLGAGIATLLVRGSPRVQRGLSVASASLHVVVSIWLGSAVARSDGIIVSHLGDWTAPHGITFVADLLAASMTIVAAAVGLAVILFDAFHTREHRPIYHPLVNILQVGVCGAFLTGDLFNLYVCFEIMLIASFVLLALGGKKPQLEGALKYVVINLISSALFLVGLALLYGTLGTLNMADIAVKVDSHPTGRIALIAMPFFLAFCIKSGLFPLFFWLPASYPTVPVAVSALFAGLLTKVGVYALVRSSTLFFRTPMDTLSSAFVVLATLTMITGVIGAVVQNDIRRILSFHILSQIGYMVLGLALLTPAGLAASVFYIWHHIIVKTNLFLVAGVIRRLGGSFNLSNIGGLARYPVFAILFLVPALSLAGVPPLSGFFAKLAIVKAALDDEHYVTAFVAVTVGIVTLMSMTKVWNEAFWKQHPRGSPDRTSVLGQLLPIGALASLTIVVGVCAGPLYNAASAVAAQLIDPQSYITAVLGEGPGP